MGPYMLWQMGRILCQDHMADMQTFQNVQHTVHGDRRYSWRSQQVQRSPGHTTVVGLPAPHMQHLRDIWHILEQNPSVLRGYETSERGRQQKITPCFLHSFRAAVSQTLGSEEKNYVHRQRSPSHDKPTFKINRSVSESLYTFWNSIRSWCTPSGMLVTSAKWKRSSSKLGTNCEIISWVPHSDRGERASRELVEGQQREGKARTGSLSKRRSPSRYNRM